MLIRTENYICPGTTLRTSDPRSEFNVRRKQQLQFLLEKLVNQSFRQIVCCVFDAWSSRLVDVNYSHAISPIDRRLRRTHQHVVDRSSDRKRKKKGRKEKKNARQRRCARRAFNLENKMDCDGR